MQIILSFWGEQAEQEAQVWEELLQSASGPEAQGIRAVVRQQGETPDGTLGGLTLDALELVLGSGFLVSTATLIYNILKDRQPSNSIKVEIRDGEAKITEAVLSGPNPDRLLTDMQTFIQQINRFEYPDSAAPRE